MSSPRRSSRVRAPSARLVQEASGELLNTDAVLRSWQCFARLPPKPRVPKRPLVEEDDDDDARSSSLVSAAAAPGSSPAHVPEFLEGVGETSHDPLPRDSPPPPALRLPPSTTPLTPWLRGAGRVLTVGGRQLVAAVDAGLTLEADESTPAVVRAPFDCAGLELLPGFFSPAEQARLLQHIATISESEDVGMSALTPSVTDRSIKLFCCTPAQRELRGGRYKSCPLRSSAAPLVEMKFDNGGDMNTVVTHLQPPADPFAVRRELLCQQIAWHLEDLEPHCDRERRDKSTERQQPMLDGVGDCIVSLTLRRPCWLLMRRTADHRDSFAIRLRPGDLYALTGDSRWKWQHGIMIEEPPSGRADCRVSMIWRILEEHPE